MGEKLLAADACVKSSSVSDPTSAFAKCYN